MKISSTVTIPDSEIQIHAIRSQGAGGQHVNKVASAIHLRFDIHASSLPDFYRQRLLALGDQRISRDGVIVIKAQEYRSREKNLAAARARLQEMIKAAGTPRRKRRSTSPSRSARQKRMDRKTKRGQIKNLRKKIE